MVSAPRIDTGSDTVLQLAASRENPYPLLAELRKKSPVEFFEPGYWLFHEYETIASVLTNREDFSTDVRLATSVMDPPPDDLLLETKKDMMTFSDGRHHRRLRSVVNRAFTPGKADQIHNELQHFCRTLMGKLAGRNAADFHGDYAQQITPAATAMLLGLPLSAAQEIGEWARRLVHLGHLFDRNALSGIIDKRKYKFPADGDEDRLATIAIVEEFLQYADGLLGRHSSTTYAEDSVLGLLVGESKRNDGLSRSSLRRLTLNILTGGQSGTASAIGNGFLTLVEHPEHRQTLLDSKSPAYWTNAINELLRFNGPFLILRRVAKNDVKIGDIAIEAGEVVLLCVASANRDPRVFSDPDALELTRSNANRQLSAGRGPHMCIGASLGTVEMHAALSSWFAEFPDSTVAGLPKVVPYAHSLGHNSIPVALSGR